MEKDTINKVRRQMTEWTKIFATHVTEKGKCPSYTKSALLKRVLNLKGNMKGPIEKWFEV